MRRSLLVFCLLLTLAACNVSVPARDTSASDGEVSANVTNHSPLQDSKETVYARLMIQGQPIAGAQMITTWHYRTVTSSCSGYTAANGMAACTRDIGGATHGYRVKISVRIFWNGHTYNGETSFTPI